MKDKRFEETEAFMSGRTLFDRKEIASAFNLEDRKALKLTLDADEYGDKGTKVKVAYDLDGTKVYETLTLRRYSDSEDIVLVDDGMCGLYKDFGWDDVLGMYEDNNLVEVKDGDKVVLIAESEKNGYVFKGTLELPKYRIGQCYKGKVLLDC